MACLKGDPLRATARGRVHPARIGCFSPQAARVGCVDHRSGAQSHLLEVQARDAAQEAEFRALFDRTEQHAEFALSLKDARKAFKSATEADIRKGLRTLNQQFQRLEEGDFFPGQAMQESAAGLRTLWLETERQLSPGEPAAAQGDVPRLNVADYQGRTWQRAPGPGWTAWPVPG